MGEIYGQVESMLSEMKAMAEENRRLKRMYAESQIYKTKTYWRNLNDRIDRMMLPSGFDESKLR